MIHIKRSDPYIDFEGDCERELTEQEWKTLKENMELLEKLPSEEINKEIDFIKEVFGIISLQRFGRYHCQPGYTDFLNPDKSYIGANPETLAKLEKYKRYLTELSQLDKGV